LGFILTLFVFIRTENIDKKLEFMSTAENYNKGKNVYIEKFKGHKSTIDNIGHSRELVSDIVVDVYSFLAEYKTVFTYIELLKINFIILRYLKSDYQHLNGHKINLHLAYLIGRLSKEEKPR